jgi:hypothetical protein
MTDRDIDWPEWTVSFWFLWWGVASNARSVHNATVRPEIKKIHWRDKITQFLKGRD